MSDDNASYRRILKSTSIVGGATVASIVIGMVRMKALALLLGPAGVGLFGVLNAIFTTGNSVAGLGLATSGVRQIAADLQDRVRVERTRVALWTLSVPLGLAAVALVFAFRGVIARASAGDGAQADAVGWVGLAIGLSIVVGIQQAELQAFQRTADLARVRVIGAAISAAMGIGAVLLWGARGIVAALIAVPVSNWLVAAWLNRDLPRFSVRPLRGRGLRSEWRLLLGLGVALTIAGSVGGLAQIGMRAVVARDLGLNAAGLFQAAWSISATNLNIVIAAMAVDYYPRLCAVSEDAHAVDALVNQQLRVALVIGGPLLLAMAVAGPLALDVLYSGRFAGALGMLRLQLVGDVLKLASFALGFALLARGRAVRYVIAEAVFTVVALPLATLATPRLGLEASGWAYLAALGATVPVTLLLARGRDRMSISRANLALMGSLIAALLIVWALARVSERGAELGGVLMTLLAGAYALRMLRTMNIARLDRMLPARWRRRIADAG